MRVEVAQDAKLGAVMDLLVELMKHQRGLVELGKWPAMAPIFTHQESAASAFSSSCQKAYARSRVAIAEAAVAGAG